jgi:transcriptional regulator with XRE-family HTH domain
MERMNDKIRRAVRVSLAERDMSQTDLAEKIGVSRQYVSRIMQGQVGRIPEAWVRILDALELELTAVPKEDDK